MHVRILGSAAGGGVPQWNCRCTNCALARAGSPDVRPRTQSSVAISDDGTEWFLLNVSPDVRQQLLAYPELSPRDGQTRGTAVAGCLLTDAELDHAAGLLLLREGPPIHVRCTPLVRRWLSRHFPLEAMLAPFANPTWNELQVDVPFDLRRRDGSATNLCIRAFDLSPHVPRYVTDDSAELSGSVIALSVHDYQTGGTLVYAPCVGELTPALLEAMREADAVLFDGTFWSDDEPIRAGVSNRSARAMGHLPVSGPDSSLAVLAALPARRRVYVHINNTNPMLIERGPESGAVTSSGVNVAADGDCFEI